MMYRTVTVTPRITKSVIRAEVGIVNPIVSVQAEYYTPVRSYGGEVDYYDGPYEFTPTQQEQTIPIQGKMAVDNITINPIPSNYGLITWDVRALTVS